MLIGENSKVVMIGDSVTDAGRDHPYGEGRGEAIGKSYVGIVEAWLTSVYPERNIRVINMGISGNKTRDLLNRWQTDVIDLKPDWVTLMIGINDIWRQFDKPLQKEIHVYIDEYEANMIKLIEETLKVTKNLVIISPIFMELNKEDAMRNAADRYTEVCRKLAEKYGLIFVDAQSKYDEFLKYRHPMSISWDRVHPNQMGHTIIARSILNALEFDWNK